MRICEKCDKPIKDNSKFCSSCGGKVVEKEDLRVRKVKRKKTLSYVVVPLILFIVVLIVASIVIFAVPFSYEATEAYDTQEPYTDTEYYYEKEPYQVCTHHSFWTGECDVWGTSYRDVRKSRTVTKYETVEHEREVWKKDTLFNMWSGKTRYWYKV